MRAYEYQPANDAFTLQLVERATPAVSPKQVLIRVRAVSLNYRDLIMLRKQAGRDVTGIVPCSDGAGEIIAVGSAVKKWRPGDRVMGCFFQEWKLGRFDLAYHKTDLGGSINGMLAEEVVLDGEGLVGVPEHLSFEEAACLPCAGLTAWYAMTVRGNFQPGDTLLALGTGGVSIFALQLAVALGGTVFITSSSDEKLARAKTLGATHLINYKTTPDWDKSVWQQSGKRGVDHVIEVGGAGTLEKSMNCVAGGGHIALIGVLTGFGPPDGSLFPLVSRNVRMNGIYVGPRDAFEALTKFLGEKQLHPTIDKTFGFDEASGAFDYQSSGSHFGKVVVSV